MEPQKQLTYTAAKYLQAIENLQEQGPVRQVHVAKYLEVSPSSCFESILRLLTRGLIHEDGNKCLSLSPEGVAMLRAIERNQYIFTTFFRDVLDRCCEDSEAMAAKIEPLLDLDTSIEMCRFVHFLEHIRGKKLDFWKEWGQFYPDPEKDSICLKCAHQKHCIKQRKQQKI